MNYRMIFNIIGKIICVEAVFMLPALLISLAGGEMKAVLGLALAMVLMLALGLPAALKKPARSDMYARDGFATVGLAWLLVSAFGALPFFISGAIPNYIDCLFETVSGFTTTGATILGNVEAMPKGLLYWRSFSHWLGGMGVLVFVLALSPLTAKDSGESMHLLRAESPGIKITKLVPRMRRSATILYTIYIALTVLEFLFLVFDMPVFDAVTLTFGTAGTGGFAVRNDGLASYSAYSQWVITAFMLIFGVNFNVYFYLILREVRKAVKNEELWAYGIIVTAAIIVITVNISGSFTTFEETVRAAAFHVASIVSTTGYGTVDFNLWPALSKTILLLLMFMGGCAGSTAGGAKVVRLTVMLKSARVSIHRALHPGSVKLIHMDGDCLDDDTVDSVKSYMMIYFIIIACVFLLISVDGMSIETNFSAAVSCVNNVGPGLDAVGPTVSYGSYSWFSKIVLTFAMLIGRLEIYPMLLLLTPATWRK